MSDNPFDKMKKAKGEETNNPLDDISTEKLFDYLVSRCKNASAEALIKRASQEFAELDKRYPPNKAKSIVGELANERVREMLFAARANETQ